MEIHTFDYFFELPGELREQILGHLVVRPAGIHLGERESFPRTTGSDRGSRMSEGDDSSDDFDNEDGHEGDEDENGVAVGWPVNYFLVSSTFYREASSLFFGENIFYLYAGVRRSTLFDALSKQGVLAPQQQSVHQKSPARDGRAAYCLLSRRRVRHLVLYIQRLGGPLEGIIVPCLQDMVLNGELRYLDVRVYHLVQQGADKRGGLWTSAPATALLGLLCDPDLEVARLCAYLSAQSPARLRAVSGWCPLLRQKGAGGHEPGTRGWATVDIDELTRRYGSGETSISRAFEENSLLRWAGM